MKKHRLILAALLLAVRVAADDPPRAVIDLSLDAGLPVLTFDLTSGTVFWVDERTNLLAGVWEEVGEGHARSGPDHHLLTTGAVSPRFFRLRYEDEFYDAGDGEAWGTFDFTILSNRVEALREAHYNLGDGGILIITNYLAGTYLGLTHDETTPDATITTTRQSYEGTNVFILHYTADTILDFDPAPLSGSSDVEIIGAGIASPSSGGTPGGPEVIFRDAHAFRDGQRSHADIVVKGNVVGAGNVQYDFGQSPLGWTPPSIARRVYELLEQGPPPFDPYPPSCEDTQGVTNAREFSVLENIITQGDTQMIEETYFFFFSYGYEYTCPNGPLRKFLIVSYTHRVVFRDRSTGDVIDSFAKAAYFAKNYPL